jgi:PDZ domain
VQVFSTTRDPDLVKPWTKQAPREARGTGVVIEGKRILTNAHMVLYQGMVAVDGLRVRFRYLAQKLAQDGRVAITVIRAGKEVPVLLPAPRTHPMLIAELQGAYPAYFIFGPLVFSTASEQFIGGHLAAKPSPLAKMLSNGSPLLARRGDGPAFPGEELVVVCSPLLPHKVARGYSSREGDVVKAINGMVVKNLRHLVELLRDARDEFVTVQFAERFTETIVLSRKDALAATDEILNDNGIRSQGSPDTMAIWNGKQASATPR